VTTWQSVVCGTAALVLGSAAVRKALDTRGFLSVLMSHPRLHRRARLLAKAVPAVEAVLALLLLVSPWVTGPAVAAGLLFVGFIAVTLTAPPGRCGCGPFVPERRSLRHLMNLVFAVGLPISVVDTAASPRGDRFLVLASAVTALLTLKLLAAARTAWRQCRCLPSTATIAGPALEIPVRLVTRP
jgi:methylamine utilization protein MauE